MSLISTPKVRKSWHLRQDSLKPRGEGRLKGQSMHSASLNSLKLESHNQGIDAFKSSRTNLQFLWIYLINARRCPCFKTCHLLALIWISTRKIWSRWLVQSQAQIINHMTIQPLRLEITKPSSRVNNLVALPQTLEVFMPLVPIPISDQVSVIPKLEMLWFRTVLDLIYTVLPLFTLKMLAARMMTLSEVKTLSNNSL